MDLVWLTVQPSAGIVRPSLDWGDSAGSFGEQLGFPGSPKKFYAKMEARHARYNPFWRVGDDG